MIRGKSYLLSILPIGVVSKNRSGDRMTLHNSELCRRIEARADAIANREVPSRTKAAAEEWTKNTYVRSYTHLNFYAV